jgi:hypothetical protein
MMEKQILPIKTTQRVNQIIQSNDKIFFKSGDIFRTQAPIISRDYVTFNSYGDDR